MIPLHFLSGRSRDHHPDLYLRACLGSPHAGHACRWELRPGVTSYNYNGQALRALTLATLADGGYRRSYVRVAIRARKHAESEAANNLYSLALTPVRLFLPALLSVYTGFTLSVTSWRTQFRRAQVSGRGGGGRWGGGGQRGINPTLLASWSFSLMPAEPCGEQGLLLHS